MKRSFDRADKAEAFIVILLACIFMLLVWVAIKTSEVERERHLTRCTKQCYPQEVDEDVSRYNCYCKQKEE